MRFAKPYFSVISLISIFISLIFISQLYLRIPLPLQIRGQGATLINVRKMQNCKNQVIPFLVYSISNRDKLYMSTIFGFL